MTLYLHGVAGEQLENLRVDQWGTWRTWGGPVGAGGPGGGPEGGPVEDQDQGLQPEAPVLHYIARDYWLSSSLPYSRAWLYSQKSLAM